MFALDQYQLLDFGRGRRLERFGEIVLDRPAPSAEPFEAADPKAWSSADARFEGREQEKGQWTDRRELPKRWTITHGRLRFELKRTEFGHLGLFPEQADNWDWIAEQLSPLPLGEGRNARTGKDLGFRVQGTETPNLQISKSPNNLCPHPRPLSQRERGETIKILNLFAYTGGSTLAAADAGAEVTHVDAARNVVTWARRNAELSGLADAPIRWIAEDAMKFVKRELRRGNHYDALILDPPSYGHGPRGEVWRLTRDLPRLLSLCAELTAGRLQFMLLTCHTPGYDATALSDMLKECFFSSPIDRLSAKPLVIASADGRQLPSGVVVRWKRKI